MLTTETDRINKNGNLNLMLIPYETNNHSPHPSGKKKIDASYNLQSYILLLISSTSIRLKSPSTMALVVELKIGSNGTNTVNRVMLDLLGPATPVDALSKLCTAWAVKVNDI